MKILIISGSHPRHLFVHQMVMDSGFDCAAIIMERESLMPPLPSCLCKQDKINFTKHFSERFDIEGAAFGDLKSDEVFSQVPHIQCKPEMLNSLNTVNFIKDYDPDCAFVFGPDLIKEPVLSVLPVDTINLHLGLSPWYKGSATLFWPFYFLQPQFAGATFHKIVSEADAGAILHQSLPELMQNDGIHQVAVKTVLKAKEDLALLLDSYSRNKNWIYNSQKSTGRLFLTRDFQPAHLRVIYDTYKNKIVDEYLNGNLGDLKPKIIISHIFNSV